MEDRLQEIKNEFDTRGGLFGGDIEWLVTEVARLRKENCVLTEVKTLGVHNA